jgi:hypothetical protein
MPATLTDLLRRSQQQTIVMTPTCMDAFETLKLRLISTPCLVLHEVSSDATFTVATYASAVDTAYVLLQDQGGCLQPISHWARKFNYAERGNSYLPYELGALIVFEAVMQW